MPDLTRDAAAPRRSATHCPYCAVQCAMHLVAGGDAGTAEVAERDFPVNGGRLCQKGWTAAELIGHPERLVTPLVRESRDRPLRPSTWGEALDRIAGGLRRAQAQHGVAAAGLFGGGGLTNEAGYALGKFARVALRTPSIDYNGRFCMSSAATAGQRAFGLDRGLPFPLEDIASTDALMLVGANPAESLPVAASLLDRQQEGGGSLIVLDPRATPTARRADLHLQPVLGTDLALANAFLHIAARDNLIDEEFIAERTSGFRAVWQRCGAYWPDRVERITGVAVEDMRRAVRMLADADTAMVLTARGAEQHTNGTDTVLAFINLALALGLAGRPGSGYGCLTGQGNGQGGREHGQKADQLPGYRRIDDPAAREHVGGVWGVDPDELPGPGRSAWEMIDAFGTDDGVRALLVLGSNIAVSAPDTGRALDRLTALDFLAVGDIFMSETAELADVVLPVAQWAEGAGTMTNLEGRVVLRRAALEPPAEVRTDLEIISGLAERIGCGDAFPSDPRTVFDELRRASAGGPADYSGITYERIEQEEGVFWPCPDPHGPGTPRLFLDAFATDDGRARFNAVSFLGSPEPLDREYPLHLTTGRTLRHYQSGTQTRRVASLRAAEPEAFVELHPLLAHREGIEEGDIVVLASRRGRATVRARLTPDIRRDTLFMPFHWGGEGCANKLTNTALDRASKMPEFKLCAVRIAQVEAQDRKQAVV
ncbi:MAG: molybdopterin oxidoreductase family protein [Thermoleophilaceae bacterium]